MDKYLLRSYILDYIPTERLKCINIQQVNNWTDFLYHHKIFELKDIYEYINYKLI
jgi:hypothetical protein